jgi:dihydroorotate dehydrogenase (fumarate)
VAQFALRVDEPGLRSSLSLAKACPEGTFKSKQNSCDPATYFPIIGQSITNFVLRGRIDCPGSRQTGVDGLELNIYSVPTDPNESSIEIETRYLRIVSAVKAAVQIPVAVKLSPYFTSFASVARKFVQQGGADALVLFNRFYQPDVDPERLEVVPDVVLSYPTALRLPLRWIAILYGKVQADLAATGGIHSATDIVKLLMAGANVTMVCSALLRYGIAHLTTLEQQLTVWMESHEYESVNQLQGCMSQLNCSDPDAFERAQYIRAVARLPKPGSADAPEQRPRTP